MAFATVWGFGNVVNNYANQGLQVFTSWILIFALYFVPYALMVGELGSTFKDEKGGVSGWINSTLGRRFAYFAGWTYWVVHIPYLAQKPQQILVAAGWVAKQDSTFLQPFSTLEIQLMCLALLFLFAWVSTKGVNTIKVIGTIAGTSMFIMGILYILLMVASPAIAPNFQGSATQNITVKSFIPTFDLHYFTTISMLVFAIGGCEKISPYVNNTKNPAREFPMGMIVLAITIAVSALLGSVAMGMMFDSNNIPADLKMNGAYRAFQYLGGYYGLGNFLLIVYAIASFASNVAAFAFSIDAPLKILLGNSDSEFIPRSISRQNKHGVPVGGYIMTTVLVSILIIIPALGIGTMNTLYNWLLDLNSIVMPMRYLWVFLAYYMIKKTVFASKLTSEYSFVKNKTIGKTIGLWCFAFTAFACIMGVIPKSGEAWSPEWNFQLTMNIVTPIVLVALGFILPLVARLNKKAG